MPWGGIPYTLGAIPPRFLVGWRALVIKPHQYDGIQCLMGILKSLWGAASLPMPWMTPLVLLNAMRGRALVPL